MNTQLLTFNSYELSYLRCFTRQTFRGSNTQEDKPYPPHALLAFIRRHNRGDIDTSFYQEYQPQTSARPTLWIQNRP